MAEKDAQEPTLAERKERATIFSIYAGVVLSALGLGVTYLNARAKSDGPKEKPAAPVERPKSTLSEGDRKVLSSMKDLLSRLGGGEGAVSPSWKKDYETFLQLKSGKFAPFMKNPQILRTMRRLDVHYRTRLNGEPASEIAADTRKLVELLDGVEKGTVALTPAASP